MAEHARLGPSGAHRWLYCPGSVAAEAGREDTAGRAAAEGTAFHEFAADCLTFDLEPEHLLGMKLAIDGGWTTDRTGAAVPRPGFEFEVDEEMVLAARPGLARIRELALDAELFVEVRVDTSRWLGPGQFGTSDVIVVDRSARLIVVFDWKYGRGVPVGAKNNAQAKLYALGALDYLERRGIAVEADWRVLTIIEQPRHHRGGGEWETTVGDLLAFGEWARERAAATLDPDAPRIPGDEQCEFCKHRGHCPELAEHLFETAQTKFDSDDGPPEVASLTVEQRVRIFRAATLFSRFLKAVHTSLMVDWQNGDPVPGLKMVAGRRGRREYAAGVEEEARETLEAMLGEDAFTEPALISPAVAEKRLGKKTYAKVVGPFVVQNQGKPALVEDHPDDERVALETADAKFEDEDDDSLFD